MYAVVVLSIAIHSCYLGSKVVVSLFALELGASQLTVGVLAAFAVCFGVALGTAGPGAAGPGAAGPGGAETVTNTLFVLTALVEIAAMVQAARARLTFAPGDPGRRTWGLIAAFLGVRGGPSGMGGRGFAGIAWALWVGQ